MTGACFSLCGPFCVRIHVFCLSFVVTKEGKRKRVWGSTAIRNSGGTREWVTLGVRVEKKGENKRHEAGEEAIEKV